MDASSAGGQVCWRNHQHQSDKSTAGSGRFISLFMALQNGRSLMLIARITFGASLADAME